MKRRDFLAKSSLASSLLLVPNFMKAFESLDPISLGYKKLVLIQLSGGNDGLNTIIPYRNDLYYKHRPSISIPKNKLIDLNEISHIENVGSRYGRFFRNVIQKMNEMIIGKYFFLFPGKESHPFI